jgi:hypothetical protein
MAWLITNLQFLKNITKYNAGRKYFVYLIDHSFTFFGRGGNGIFIYCTVYSPRYLNCTLSNTGLLEIVNKFEKNWFSNQNKQMHQYKDTAKLSVEAIDDLSVQFGHTKNHPGAVLRKHCTGIKV